MTTSLRDKLSSRAQYIASCREFLNKRGVIEVDTNLVQAHAVSDVHLNSFKTACNESGDFSGYLVTSPEFAMKKLLASGSGDIYQMSHVFRSEIEGRWHKSEFMMCEWYRLGFSYFELMDEVWETNKVGLSKEDIEILKKIENGALPGVILEDESDMNFFIGQRFLTVQSGNIEVAYERIKRILEAEKLKEADGDN